MAKQSGDFLTLKKVRLTNYAAESLEFIKPYYGGEATLALPAALQTVENLLRNNVRVAFSKKSEYWEDLAWASGLETFAQLSEDLYPSESTTSLAINLKLNGTLRLGKMLKKTGCEDSDQLISKAIILQRHLAERYEQGYDLLVERHDWYEDEDGNDSSQGDKDK